MASLWTSRRRGRPLPARTELRHNRDRKVHRHQHATGGRTMALFCCSKCGCVEDTTLCHYWSARVRRLRLLCSACDPTIAKWHGEFAQAPADDGWARDEHRLLLWNKRELEDWLGPPIEVVSKPAASPPLAPDPFELDKAKAPGRLIAGA